MGFQFTNKSPLLIYNNCEYYIFVFLIFIPAAAFSRKTQLHKDRKIPPRQAPVLSIACLEGIIATPLPPGYDIYPFLLFSMSARGRILPRNRTPNTSFASFSIKSRSSLTSGAEVSRIPGKTMRQGTGFPPASI